jgi:predicted phosphodiesterase
MSDIHSNLEALESVLKAMRIEQIDKIICLGDIVGYGPNPNECVERIQEIDGLILAGNHDLAAIGWKDIEWFSSYAKEAILWTEDKLTIENKNYLSHLPEVMSKEDFILVHGSLYNFTDEYIMTSAVAKKSFDIMSYRKLLIAGHTHYSTVFFRKQVSSTKKLFPIQNLKLINGDVLSLLDDVQSIITIGSVGQPRDGDNRAAFGILDLETMTVTIKRIPYDIKKTQAQMIKAELPKYLISRLAMGR